MNSFSQINKRVGTPKTPAKVVIEENPMTYFTKNYISQNEQGYWRKVDRYYYGHRDNTANTFKKNNYKKGINILDYNKYSTASFYPTDMYTMPEEKKEIAIELFRPIIDSILNPNNTSKVLKAEIVVFGYTDEEAVDINSVAFSNLMNKSQSGNFSEISYQNYLSYLRAEDVGDIISTLMMINSDILKNYDEVIVDIIMEGRGIEYPEYTREYELEDAKRKIAKVYWKVF